MWDNIGDLVGLVLIVAVVGFFFCLLWEVEVMNILKTSKGYTLRQVAENMFQVVKLNQTYLPADQRDYVQKSVSAFPYLVDAGSQDPCYWLGEIIDSNF